MSSTNIKNKLIATFLGLEIVSTNPNGTVVYKLWNKLIPDIGIERYSPYDTYIKYINECHEYYLEFHKNWNWLMYVIEKIQFFAHVKIENGQCLISVNGDLIVGIVNGSTIENVFEAVCKYIEWFNNK